VNCKALSAFAQQGSSDLREHRGLGMPIVSKIKVGDATWLRDNSKGTKEPFVEPAGVIAHERFP